MPTHAVQLCARPASFIGVYGVTVNLVHAVAGHNTNNVILCLSNLRLEWRDKLYRETDVTALKRFKDTCACELRDRHEVRRTVLAYHYGTSSFSIKISG